MFSMCSELTPRARIPDTRIPQLMQPWQRIILTFLDEARSNIKEKRWVFRIWSLFDRKFVIISQYCLMLQKTPGNNIVSLNNVKVRKTVENIRQRFLTLSQSSVGVRTFIFCLKCGGKDAVRNLIALSVCLGVGYKLKQPFNIPLLPRQLLQCNDKLFLLLQISAFFLFSDFRKGRLLYICPVGWLVGWRHH